jgi:hypothetical protein
MSRRRGRKRERERERERERQMGLDELCRTNSRGRQQQLGASPKKETCSGLSVGTGCNTVYKGIVSPTLLVYGGAYGQRPPQVTIAATTWSVLKRISLLGPALSHCCVSIPFASARFEFT